jgi:hypothetical protein
MISFTTYSVALFWNFNIVHYCMVLRKLSRGKVHFLKLLVRYVESPITSPKQAYVCWLQQNNVSFISSNQTELVNSLILKLHTNFENTTPFVLFAKHYWSDNMIIYRR